MSIILKGNNKSGGSFSKGIAPSPVYDVKIQDLGNGQLKFSWKDPDDYIISGTTLSTWANTVLIYNDQHVPIDIKDGTILCTNAIKNNYSEMALELNVTPDKYFYYRFFTVSTDNVVNNDPEFIYKLISKTIKTTLAENDWDIIINTINNGKAKDYWKVGDEIDIFLGGEFNETMTLQIWDFDHYNKTDGTGKSSVVFGTKHLTTNKYPLCLESKETQEYGWGNWSAILDTMKKLKAAMIPIISDNIKEVHIDSYTSFSTNDYKSTKDYIVIPDQWELVDRFSNSELLYKFPIFTDQYSRIKKMSNGAGENGYWHTRTSTWENGYAGNPNSIVQDDGNFYGNANAYSASWEYSLCFLFNI